MTTLVEIILEIEDAMAVARLPHAFGGALALAFHVEEPRATRDIDINVFVPAQHARVVVRALPPAITCDDHEVGLLERDGQARLFYEDTPIDVFLANHPFHAHAAANVIEVPLLDRTIPILSATDLAVFKVFFDRTKDWADLEAMAEVGSVDLHVVIGWVVHLLGVDDPRIERLRALLVA